MTYCKVCRGASYWHGESQLDAFCEVSVLHLGSTPLFPRKPPPSHTHTITNLFVCFVSRFEISDEDPTFDEERIPGTMFLLRATRDLLEGEEVTICYDQVQCPFLPALLPYFLSFFPPFLNNLLTYLFTNIFQSFLHSLLSFFLIILPFYSHTLSLYRILFFLCAALSYCEST